MKRFSLMKNNVQITYILRMKGMNQFVGINFKNDFFDKTNNSLKEQFNK